MVYKIGNKVKLINKNKILLNRQDAKNIRSYNYNLYAILNLF